MEHRTLACFMTLLALTTSEREQTRWSRQISDYTSDLGDWIPLAGPVERNPSQYPITTQSQIKRQAIAEPRILAEPVYQGFVRPTGFSQDFPSRTYVNGPNRHQLYLQSAPAVPSAPQNYLSDHGFHQPLRTDQAQIIKFGLSQPNFPLTQGFVGPQLGFENPKNRLPSIPNPVTFENYQKPNLPSPQTKPFISHSTHNVHNQAPQKFSNVKFVDGYRAENTTYFGPPKRKPQSLQNLKYDFEKIPKTEMVPPKSKSEREEVQLLYVPLESLNRGQFNFKNTQGSLINTEPQSQTQRLNLLNQNFGVNYAKPLSKAQGTFNTNPDFYSGFNSHIIDQVPKFSTISSPFPTLPPTTPRPKKLKPHQPPLAIFMIQETNRGNLKVGDVLSTLKNAETIAVLDVVNPATAPKVFIGPSNLSPPDHYIKFELPYLSNIEHSDKKIRQLPFFVAPLSYTTPTGFAKIPFPSPHVGSVVINSQIKETNQASSTPAAEVMPNSYSTPNQYGQEKTVTQKPRVSFYSTSPPRTNPPIVSNYYSIEPQQVSPIGLKEPAKNLNPPKKNNSYFIRNYDSQNQDVDFDYSPGNVENTYENLSKRPIITTSTTTTSKPRYSIDSDNPQSVKKTYEHLSKRPTSTTTTTTVKPSTYPTQLIETHNPFSINQAFHFSTPLDYHNLFEETYATPGISTPPPSSSQASSSTTANPPSTPSVSVVTEERYQSSPNYLQNYSPEIHYESEVTNSRYPVYNANDYTTQPSVPEYRPLNSSDSTGNTQTIGSTIAEYNINAEANPTAYENTDINKVSEGVVSSISPYYNQYQTNYEQEKTSPASSTTTTTTRKTLIRGRGRPRSTSTPKPESGEYTPTKTASSRKPIRERRPLPNRSRYEPNKVSTERTTRKPADSSENTTKFNRSRTRGRVQFKPSESDQAYKGNKQNTKEADLAYQRDVLHQNYPVTLMERTSTVDIEAITEPVPKISSTKNVETTEVYDTVNAYSNDRAAISQQPPQTDLKEVLPTYTPRTEYFTETPIFKKLSTLQDYSYQSRSSNAPVEAYDDTPAREEEIYAKKTTPVQEPEIYSYSTEPSSTTTKQKLTNYSINEQPKQEEATTIPVTETSKIENEELNVVQTTPSYNRVRVRPGVIRQYHQASSTETARTKMDRKRPLQAVTYRPAFNGRRTTMRIEEIAADLKTKSIHSRGYSQERHPVYKPDPTTEPTATLASQESTTKRGGFRHRPSYITTTTEASPKQKTYESKNRFRGRRPTNKSTTQNTDTQSETTTTIRSSFHSRYSNRPRLSERYNKKPDQESEDQESNYSINRPKYVEPDSDQWSPKISSDTFRPYNPNDIIDDKKDTTTERRSEIEEADIITARNNIQYGEDILISVTPATNNRINKKIPDILPTLEALIEQSKVNESDSGAVDKMSTFETMLEEVMKSLEEEDQDEYTNKVIKHKGGEIGEIPPERIISSGDYYAKDPPVEPEKTTSVEPTAEGSSNAEVEQQNKSRRRGYWKKVKVRPVTETIETAESQYYQNTVNRLGQTISVTKTVHDKSGSYEKPKVTTYKPVLNYFKEIEKKEDDLLPTVDIYKLTENTENKIDVAKDIKIAEVTTATESLTNKDLTQTEKSAGDKDLGIGTSDPTVADIYSPTEAFAPSSESQGTSYFEKVNFSFMDYLFGTSSNGEDNETTKKITTEKNNIEISTELAKPKQTTIESSYIPEEITATSVEEKNISDFNFDSKKVDVEKVKEVVTEGSVKVETSSESSFMDPNNVVSTSMSTEISHETEICFRGKCIKTNKDIKL